MITTQLIKKTPSAYEYPLILKQIIQMPLYMFPDKKIYYQEHVSYTYQTLYKRISALANVLKDLDVRPGQTIGVMDWDSHRYLESFFAIPMMGAIMHTINIRLSHEQIVYTINHAEDDVLLVHEDFLPIIEAVRNQLTTVKHIICLSDSPTPAEPNITIVGHYDTLVEQAPETFDFQEFDENTWATTFYTTGTTGLPKGVYFSHRQLVLHTYGLLSIFNTMNSQAKLSTDDVYMPLTPMFHVHAWGMPYLCTMLGMTQVYPGRYEPQRIIQLIDSKQVTFSHCVPTILHMILNHPCIKDVDLSKWQIIIGGSALPKSLCQAAMDVGINVYSAYGMSETGPLLTVANLKSHMITDKSKSDQIAIRCKTGLPASLVQIRIIDPDGNDVPHDGISTGEIVARAPWLTQGYYKDEDNSESLWQDGWLHTGDIGTIDEEGYLQITDRLKDVIKTGGEWISSLALEDLFLQHQSVSECAIIGVPDQKWGERPFAMIVLKPEYKDKTTPDDIRSFLLNFAKEGLITKYAVPEKIEFVDTIAKTSVGKINKRMLREQWRSLNRIG